MEPMPPRTMPTVLPASLIAPTSLLLSRNSSATARRSRAWATGLAAGGSPAPATGAGVGRVGAPSAAASASRLARSATSPAESALRSSVAVANRRSGLLARQRMTASSSAGASFSWRESGAGRRLRWFCWTSAEAPQNGGRPASIS